LKYLLYMNPKKKEGDKKVKITISINPKINEKMEKSLINKSKLINELLINYYGKENL